MQTSLNYKLIFVFFLPLIFMTELHQFSHSIVHAFLARLADPKLVLAAFSIAFAFNTTISSINQISIQGGISFIGGRSSFWKIFRFYGAACIILLAAIESVALTSLGDILFGKWMGASAEVVRQARVASAIMGLWTIPILIRNITYALVMVHRRTILITNATVIRLAALVIFMLLYPFWLEGAAVGAAALVSCMTVEAVYMVMVSRPLLTALEKEMASAPSYSEIWRFSWPLMITQSSESGVPLAINFFLGQLPNPDLALAGFGVAIGLVRTILSPLRNLVQTAQTLIRSRKELKIMFRFTLMTVLFFVGMVFLLFYTPLEGIILEKVMGLTPELSQYAAPGLKLTFLVAIFWGYSALLRGVLSAMRRTGAIAFTVFIRLAVVVATCSLSLLCIPDFNGTIIGVLALSGAFASEAAFLIHRLRRHYRTGSELFPRR